MKNSSLLLIGFILIILGWMSMLEIGVESKALTNSSTIRVTRSVRACKRSQHLQLPPSFRVCQNHVSLLLKYICNAPYQSGDQTNESNSINPITEDTPTHSNVVDACCKNCCSEQQLFHYCKEFRSRARLPQPQPQPLQQETLSDTGRLLVGMIHRFLLLAGNPSQTTTGRSSDSSALRGWREFRASEPMPTESQLEVGGESSDPTDDSTNIFYAR